MPTQPDPHNDVSNVKNDEVSADVIPTGEAIQVHTRGRSRGVKQPAPELDEENNTVWI